MALSSRARQLAAAVRPFTSETPAFFPLRSGLLLQLTAQQGILFV